MNIELQMNKENADGNVDGNKVTNKQKQSKATLNNNSTSSDNNHIDHIDKSIMENNTVNIDNDNVWDLTIQQWVVY